MGFVQPRPAVRVTPPPPPAPVPVVAEEDPLDVLMGFERAMTARPDVAALADVVEQPPEDGGQTVADFLAEIWSGDGPTDEDDRLPKNPV